LNRVELYEHRANRVDTNDVAAQHPQQAGKMVTEIGQWMEKQKQIRSVLGRGANATVDQDTLEKLRSLGYLGGK